MAVDQQESKLHKRISSWIHIALIPAALIMGIWAAMGLPAAYNGSTGHGQHGTFTAESRSGGRISSWRGVYRSDDGTKTKEMFMEGFGAEHPGDVVAVVDSGVPGTVYSIDGSNGWFVNVLCMIIGFGYASVAFAWFTLRTIFRGLFLAIKG